MEKARQILSHPNFNKLSPEQIQVVFRSLLANGITKDQITAILESRNPREINYLESLPYNVFTNLVLTQKIEGKDLISLCNSSPLINEKCNKAFTAKDGKIVPQYLFYTLLLKMGIDPGIIYKIDIKDYRDLYKKAISNQPFKSLEQKLRLIASFEKSMRTGYPKTIYDLLYTPNNDNYYVSLFWTFFITNDLHPYYTSFTKAIEIIDKLKELRKYQVQETENENLRFNLVDLAKGSKMTFNNYISSIVNYSLRDTNLTPDDLLNANDIFHTVLNDLFKMWNISRDDLKERIIGRWNVLVYYLVEELKEQEEKQEIIDAVRAINHLSKEELDYLVYLHEKVLSGELPVLTLFRYDELLKY